jgi:tetratricopeptide (TPR) repeat protein
MDPLTLSVQKLIREIDATFTPPPGAGGPTTALRVVASHSRRRALVNALRLREWQPDARRPLFLVESTEPRRIAEQLRDDYAALTRGLAADHVTLRPIADSPLSEQDPAWREFMNELSCDGHEITEAALLRRAEIERLRRAILSAAKELAATGALDGLVLAVVPSRRDAVATADLAKGLLAKPGEGGTLVQWLVWAPVVSDDVPASQLLARELKRLVPASVRLDVDEAALRSYLRDLEPRPSAGPKVNELGTTPEQRRALEKATGSRVASKDAARTLRRLIVDAGEALDQARPAAAARKLRAARTLCRLCGLAAEEATLMVMVGAAELDGDDEIKALAAFREAQTLAAERGFLPALVQALLGMAGVHVRASRFREAEATYGQIGVETNDRAGLEILSVEAYRMRAVCLEQLGRLEEARVSLDKALEQAEALPAAAVRVTAYEIAGARLAALCDALGDGAGATRARARTKALTQRARDGGDHVGLEGAHA